MADDGVGPAVGTAVPLGRRVTYSDTLGDAILARVMRGESVSKICADPAMPHRTTVRAWARSDPEFGGSLLAALRTVRMRRRLADREAAARPRDNRGRWSTYTPDVGEAICERLANGESLTAIARDPQMPCYATIQHWVRRHADFQEMYVTARELQADYLFDEARDVALAATPRTVWVGRLQFDVIRWQASKLAPRKYIERLAVLEAQAKTKAEDDEVRIYVVRFERSPDGTEILAIPPRNEEEEARYARHHGRRYDGPHFQVRSKG